MEGARDNGPARPAAPTASRIFPNASEMVWCFVTSRMTGISRGEPLSFGSCASRSLRTAANTVKPLSEIQTMDKVVAEATGQSRFYLVLLGAFAAVALVLAGVGIYGVMSYSVSRRTHEIGIRMALGAQGRDVLRLVVFQGITHALVGVAVGLAGALGLSRLMAGLLYGTQPNDPATFGAVVLGLSSLAILASYIPARRAAKVDPMVALRYE